MTVGALSVLYLLIDNAGGLIKGREIGAKCGMQSQEVRAMVNELRCKGYPVCANGGGYFLSANADDVRQTIKGMEGRIRAMEHAVNGLYRALDELEECKNEQDYYYRQCVRKAGTEVHADE